MVLKCNDRQRAKSKLVPAVYVVCIDVESFMITSNCVVLGQAFCSAWLVVHSRSVGIAVAHFWPNKSTPAGWLSKQDSV